MTAEKRARDTLSAAKERSDKADEEVNAASVAHANALEKFEAAQTKLANARQKLADTVRQNAQVASADEKAIQSANDMLDAKKAVVEKRDGNLKSQQESLAAVKQKRSAIEKVEGSMDLVVESAERKQGALEKSESEYRAQAEAIHTGAVTVAANDKSVENAVNAVDHAVKIGDKSNQAIVAGHSNAQEYSKQAAQATVHTAKEAKQDLVAAQQAVQKAAVSKGDAKHVLDTSASQKKEQDERHVEAEEAKSKVESDYQVVEAKYLLEEQAAQKATRVWKDSHAKMMGEHFKVKNREQEEDAAREKVSLMKKHLMNEYGVDANNPQEVSSLDGSQASQTSSALEVV